jgi:hypothetical protein
VCSSEIPYLRKLSPPCIVIILEFCLLMGPQSLPYAKGGSLEEYCH